MKGKVIRGSGFRGVLNYVLDDEKKAYIVGGNMTGQDAKGLAREFSRVRQLRPGCEKPVLHIPLRLPDGEDVSDVRWLEITLSFLRLMQLSPNRPWVIVKHLNNHIHLITSRVDNNGKIWAGKWEGLRCIEATQQLEKLFRLTITPGLAGRNRKQVRLTSGQLRKISREMDRGEEPEVPVKVQIAERIEQAISESNGTFSDFEDRLEKLGVTTRLNIAKTSNHVSGISFEFGGIVMKGSKVARAYSWQGLNQLLIARKDSNENIRTAQQNLTHGPEPINSRTGHPAPSNVGQRVGPTRKRSGNGNVPTSPPVPVVVRNDDHSGAGPVPDLLLALLGKPPVAAGGGSIADPAIRAPGKAHIPRERVATTCEDDDEPAIESDGPTMSF